MADGGAKAKLLTEKCLESSRNTKNLSIAALAAMEKMMECLDQTGETLDQAENDFDQINSNLKESEEYMDEMDTCCCTMPCAKSGERAYGDDDGKKKGNEDRPNRPGGLGMSAGSFMDMQDEEIEANLVLAVDNLAQIKKMAINLKDETALQNMQMDNMMLKCCSIEQGLKDACERAKKIIST